MTRMEKLDSLSEESTGMAYSYRPSLLGASWEFQLGDDTLVWQAGRRGGRIAYRDISKVRMSFRPVTMQNHRFITQIWSRSAPKLDIASTSVKNMVEQSRQDDSYTRFVTELHRRVAASGSAATFVGGKSPLVFWPGVLVFTAAFIGLVVLAVRALQLGDLAAVAFVAAFLALFLWQIGGYLWRNQPQFYRPDALPPGLMPR